MTSFLDRLNTHYFVGNLSPGVLALLAGIEYERPEVHRFVERMARQMRAQRHDPRDFSEFLAWIVATFIPKLLPGAWGGSVPPITLAGRHVRIDDYLERNPWHPLRPGSRFLDLGCGFPPLTTVDSARRFPEVSIVGADPSFGRYLVRRNAGDYACFNAELELLYFQPGSNEAARWDLLYRDPDATRATFIDELRAALPALPADEAAHGTVTLDGFSVTRHPVLAFTLPNLRFDQRGIGSDGIGRFDLVRCFNVLVYFNRSFRLRALDWLPTVLEEGGLFISGMDWTHSSHARYAAYTNVSGRMVAREFALGIENVRPLEVLGWFALHDDDYDTAAMARVVGLLRADDAFRRDFDARMDALQAETGFCARNQAGYLGGIPETAAPEVLDLAAKRIGAGLEQDGFPERAVEILRRSGIDAWVNCVGHVAVDPAALNV